MLNPGTTRGAQTGTLSTSGARLQTFVDGLTVEANWIAGHHIVWQTGQQNGPDGEGPEGHPHCSAFVAAVALDLDIYILRPPHHSQELLANAPSPTRSLASCGKGQGTPPSCGRKSKDFWPTQVRSWKWRGTGTGG